MRREAWHVRAAYFQWLYSQVLSAWDDDSPYSYINVCTHLHSVSFEPRIANDENRAKDAGELRDHFIADLSIMNVEDYVEMQNMGPPTVFEVLVALAYKADYMVEMGVAAWFRTFLENLKLIKYNDPAYVPRDIFRIMKIIKTLNERTYSRSGEGGLFPLRSPENDQRTIEIWYQMAAFIMENHLY